MKLDSPAYSRRALLRGGTAASVLAALQGLQVRSAFATDGMGLQRSPYGPIAPVADLSTGLPLLQLPRGFAYRSFGWTGDLMSDGQPCPAAHDGMAVLRLPRPDDDQDDDDGDPPDDDPIDIGAQTDAAGRRPTWVLVRNHELDLGSIIDAPGRYDTALVSDGSTVGRCAGGTTNLMFRGRRWVGMRASLGGTLGNCAGGPTPWGSWLTCEETIADLTALGGRKHGYVFEVTADPSQTSGRPLVGMGRFEHEATAVDPRTGIVYLTEDSRNVSALYRYVPRERSGRAGSLARGGKLQAARVVGHPNADLIVARVGDEHALEWIDIAQPDADPELMLARFPAFPDIEPDTIASGPFLQAWSNGALRMSRGEGLWTGDGKLYIVDTSTGVDASGGRGRGEGSVWALDLKRQVLKAVFVSSSPLAGNNPDNITVSPRGGVLCCEDGGGVSDRFGFGDRFIGLLGDGGSYAFAKNNVQLDAAQIASAGKHVEAGDYRGNEFAGACFEPRGRVLFVNIQTPGITFAIWGPFGRGPL